MVVYSHSRLGTFQQCRYKYKLQYIDRIKVDVPDTIETYMGKLVHETLEKLYKDLKFNKVNSKEELVKFYLELWDKKWSDTILIVKKEYSKENYMDMGKKFIEEYYDHYKPFDQTKTLGLETEDRLDLENENQYHIRIDRLACDREGNYYICDYKTNNRLKIQDELDEDRQLAMYSLWVKDKFKDCNDVKLVWYFLAFDKEMVSERSDKQLLELKKETEKLIREIEGCDNFETNVNSLCSWCKFQEMCPAWKHKFMVEEEKVKYGKDDGVKLVDEYSKLVKQKKEAEDLINGLKEKLVEFSKQKEIEVVFGTVDKVSVKEYNKVVLPEDREELIKILKENGNYEEFSMLNYMKLSSKILKEEVDRKIIEIVKKEKAYRLSLSKRKG